jgi:hypothetical protein
MKFPNAKVSDGLICGVEYSTKEGDGVVLYNHTGSAIAKGQPVMVGFASVADTVSGDDSTAGSTGRNIHVQAAAPATNTTVLKQIVIAEEAVANHKFGKFRKTGYVDALVYTAAQGDPLEVLNGGTYLVVDGSTGTCTETVQTVGIVVGAANTAVAAALRRILLKGEPCQIQSG